MFKVPPDFVQEIAYISSVTIIIKMDHFGRNRPGKNRNGACLLRNRPISIKI